LMDFFGDDMNEMQDMFMMKREKMLEHRKDKGFLGVYIKSTGEDAETKGSIINKVIANSGAEKAGLEEGDIITKVNGKSVDGHEELVEQLRSYKPGESVSIDYIRDGKSQTTTTAEKLKERKLLAEAEMREIDLEEVKGRLIDVDKVRDVWIHMASNFKSKMTSLPTKIASSCYGRAKPQIQREAQALINQALEELANSEPDE